MENFNIYKYLFFLLALFVLVEFYWELYIEYYGY